MAIYKFIGETPLVFTWVQNPDSSTLLAEPGESYELLVDPKSELLVAIADAVASVASVPEAPQSAPEAPVAPSN
jgi:hypothetical protein